MTHSNIHVSHLYWVVPHRILVPKIDFEYLHLSINNPSSDHAFIMPWPIPYWGAVGLQPIWVSNANPIKGECARAVISRGAIPPLLICMSSINGHCA